MSYTIFVRHFCNTFKLAGDQCQNQGLESLCQWHSFNIWHPGALNVLTAPYPRLRKPQKGSSNFQEKMEVPLCGFPGSQRLATVEAVGWHHCKAWYMGQLTSTPLAMPLRRFKAIHTGRLTINSISSSGVIQWAFHASTGSYKTCLKLVLRMLSISFHSFVSNQWLPVTLQR